MRTLLLAVLLLRTAGAAADSFLPLAGPTPRSLAELWAGYDPRKEPLDVEVVHQWEEEGVVCRVVRYRAGTFKGSKAMIAAIYGFPKEASRLPGLVQVHGGGQSANRNAVTSNAKLGYATISVNWGGNPMSVPGYKGPNTDWGKVDAISPSDFRDSDGAVLQRWAPFVELAIGDKDTVRANRKATAVGKEWTGPRPQFRNLRWAPPQAPQL